jgi:hypothetical protein
MLDERGMRYSNVGDLEGADGVNRSRQREVKKKRRRGSDFVSRSIARSRAGAVLEPCSAWLAQGRVANGGRSLLYASVWRHRL